MKRIEAIVTAWRRRTVLARTNARQIEMGQTFNQRAKFAVWDRRTDLGEHFWGTEGWRRRRA